MNKLKSILAFTLIELLVVISIIAILASFAVPAVLSGLTQGQLTQAINNCKQIHLATFNMSNDAVTTGDATLGWPGEALMVTGSTPLVTNADLVFALVANDYLKAGDLKIFAATGITPYPVTATTGTNVTDFKSGSNCAYKIFKITQQDDPGVVYITTKNFSYGLSPAITGSAAPFGDKGFIVFHKGGDGAKYKGSQANKPGLLGLLPLISGSGATQEQGSGKDYLQNTD